MAAISSLPFAALRRAADWRPSTATAAVSVSGGVMLNARARRGSRSVVRCVITAGDIPPTVADTKMNFLKSLQASYSSIYSTVLQELLVQQHLMRYKEMHYQYDPVFALGFVTDRDAIFKSYVTALNEDPEQYRADAQRMEEWARSQNGNLLVEFSSRDGNRVHSERYIRKGPG
ncbi:hypothetical protein ZWY2020_059807 [Hordeum vulgare]|nr:hypothetical protein ZWY2020_059807 [Hordeum vulgare]